MKNLILLIFLVNSIHCIAQDPDPDLFQTWYLTDMFIEFGPPLELMEPPVYATLTISESLDFSGQGSCNTFTGIYTYNPMIDSMFYIEFNRTNMDCVFPYHNSFETEYFEDVRGQWFYEITDDGVGLQLHIYDLWELSATFKNYPLSIPDVERIEVTMYPNPVNDILTISSPNNEILAISMHTVEGKKVTSFEKMNQGMNEINIVNLDSGIYFLEILTDSGRVTKKIIKE